MWYKKNESVIEEFSIVCVSSFQYKLRQVVYILYRILMGCISRETASNSKKFIDFVGKQ